MLPTTCSNILWLQLFFLEDIHGDSFAVKGVPRTSTVNPYFCYLPYWRDALNLIALPLPCQKPFNPFSSSSSSLFALVESFASCLMIYLCILSICTIKFVVFNKIYKQTRLCLALYSPRVTRYTKVLQKSLMYFLSLKTTNNLDHFL